MGPPSRVRTGVKTRPKARPAAPALHPFDEAHGVETGGLVPAGGLVTGHSSDRHVTAYYGVAPSILRQMVDLWRESSPKFQTARYCFVDVGAGKGRAMLIASELGFRRVVGVELNPAMADIAQTNIDHWIASHACDSTAAAIAPIRLMEQDALEFELPTGPCVVFLFHPFEAPLMRRFLRRLETQAAGRTGELDVLYVNAECAQVFASNPAFQQLWFGRVAMSAEDHVADRAAIAEQKEYGSTGDEECALYRYVGRGNSAPATMT